MAKRTNDVTSAAASGMLYSFLLRLLSFALTQMTIRFVDPKTLGKTSIRLELMSTTVLFLGREGFRLALVKVAIEKEQEKKDGDGDGDGDEKDKEKASRIKTHSLRVNNVAWLSVPTSLLLTSLAVVYHLSTYEAQFEIGNNDTSSSTMRTTMEQTDYMVAGLLYCLAAAIEIMSEPCMILCLRTMDVKTRATAEGFASIGKAVCCVVLLSWSGDNYRASSFGFSQCVYAIIVTRVLYTNVGKKLQMPTRLKNENDPHIRSTKVFTSLSGMIQANFDVSSLRLSVFFAMQSIFKHALTEGDRIVLSALLGTYDSGVYAMASSYGGIASRLIFQPLEENGRLLFSNFHGSIVEARQSRKHADVKHIVQQLESVYCVLVKLVFYLGLILAVFGSNYSATLLQILAGDRWGSNAEAIHTLSAFCAYMFTMALNGMTEAFVYGVTDSGREVAHLSIAHSVIGVVFYVSAPILILRNGQGIGGTVGLIMANGICMIIRVLYSLYCAVTYFSKYGDSNDRTSQPFLVRSFYLCNQIVPKAPILLSFFVSWIIMNWSKTRLNKGYPLLSIQTSIHLGTGIICFAMTGSLIFHYDKIGARRLRGILRRRTEKID
uniref:Protein RFT1 homolog n=1 Tax=Chaetoceros debilis TaxID=122233 RepID=A0A7S3VGS5_9STRA|mmetsp:Transcript_4914/g.7213  ORF Transcript_4914/g.7213 Transcript_4914/m.7213 type:complete len:606 (+) Transcript_4914:159-1976(+)